MNLAYQATDEPPAMPAIDASVPTTVETASFGLG
jgi:hypothetical protein